MTFSNKILESLLEFERKLLKATSFRVKQRQHISSTTQCRSKEFKILFFGTDNFSLPSLKILHKKSNISMLTTVTSFKNPANSVRLYAEENRLPLFRWPISAGMCEGYDIGVVVSFGHLIPSSIIKALPLGMINVHASLLPRWRGAAPIIYSLMNGDTVTGVSIMRIEPKHFDIGDILAQLQVPIRENCFMPELHNELAHQGAELLLDVLRDYDAKSKNAWKQEESLATYAPKVTSILTEVVWSELNANDLYRRFRALYGYKYLTTRFDEKNVQLIEIKLPAANDIESQILQNYKIPGSFTYIKEKERSCLLVRCSADTFIEIHKLRVEGRKIMSALDFSNGFLKHKKTTQNCFIANKNASC